MNIQDRIESHYKRWTSNGLGDDFGGLRTNGIYIYSTISSLFRHYPLHKLSDTKILDFGSGTGRIAKLIVEDVKEYVCADISPLFLNDCKNNLKEHKNCQFHQIRNTPLLDFKDNYFDFSFSYLSLYDYSKEEYKKNLLEIDRVSRDFAVRLCGINDYDLGFFARRKALSKLNCKCTFDELRELFKTKNYIFEVLQPEPKVHSGCLFLYKISENLDLHLKFGPHIYEKALNADICLSPDHRHLTNLKNILDISPLQCMKFLKRKTKAMLFNN